MKMKHILALALCLALLLCGCSANSSANTKQEYFSQIPGEVSGSDVSFGYAQNDTAAKPSVVSDRKLIRRVTMSAETEDMDALLNALSTRITALGGYVESRNIHHGSAYQRQGYRSATLVIRIPADQLDGFLEQVGQYSNIVSTYETSDDVTLQYVDTQSRLKMLRTEEERLLKFLSDAANVSEMLEVEKRLTQVQSDIESLTAQLKTYDNLVSYGTVTLNVTEVEIYTPSQDPSLWQRIQTTFANSLKGLGSICQALLVFILGYSPYLLFYALIPGSVLLIIWIVSRKKKKKPEAPKGEAPQ